MVATSPAPGMVPVDLWVRRAADVPEGLALLDGHERGVLAQLGSASTARAYAAGHVLARRAVADVVEGHPGELRFDRTCGACGGQHGRPTVIGHPDVHVSLSRADGFVAVAVARDHPVGVDIEVIGRTGFVGFPGVALHPEERDEPPDSDARARLRAIAWARKEAALKALGTGLRTDPARVRTPPSGTPTDLLGDGARVTVIDVPAVWHTTAIALAVVDAGAVTVRQH